MYTYVVKALATGSKIYEKSRLVTVWQDVGICSTRDRVLKNMISYIIN